MKLLRRFAAGLALAVLATTVLGPSAPAKAATPVWTVTYQGTPPAAAQAAVQRAVDAWAAVFPSTRPVSVQVTWGALPVGTLAVGAPADVVVHRPDTGVLYPIALEEATAGTDLNAGAPDVTIALQGDDALWSYTTTPDPTRYDLATLTMRALGTGLGIGSGTAVRSGLGSYGADDNGDGAGDGGYPPVYDALVAGSAPRPAALLDQPNGSAVLATALTSGALTWTGAQATAVTGSAPVLATPANWTAGVTGSYLDETRYPRGSADALMTPVIDRGEVVSAPGPVATAMLRDMINDPGAVGAPVRHYVNELYHSFLYRDVDPTGLPYWTAQLVTGQLNRLQVAVALSQSQEYLQAVVTVLYNDVLGRAPDAAGLQGWVSLIQGGLPIATVGASFYASDENYARTGGTAGAPGPWVEGLYRALLGRASDPAGKAYWSGQAKTQGRLFVTTQFYASNETLARRVSMLYLALLDRDVDPVGLAYWPAVVRDQGDLALAAVLATSDEYYQRALSYPLPSP